MLAVALLLAVFLELLLSAVLVGQPHPSLVLLLALSAGMLRGRAEGALLAFGGGLLLDALAGPPLGRQALALVVATLPSFLVRTELARRTALAPVLAVGLGSVLYCLTLSLEEMTMGLRVMWPQLLLRWLLPALLMNLLLALPAFQIVRRLSARRRASSVAGP